MKNHSAKLVRFSVTYAKIRAHHISGFGRTDDEIARTEGYTSAAEFWKEATSLEMSAHEFADMLYTMQRAPLQNPPNTEDELLELRIIAVMRSATRSEKTWLKRDQSAPAASDDNLKHWRIVDVGAALAWWREQPLHADLLPTTFRSSAPAVEAKQDAPKKKTRPPVVRDRVQAWLENQARIEEGDTASGLAAAFIESLPIGERKNWKEDSVRKVIGNIRKNPVKN